MSLNRIEIDALIPHSGAMCLLERVTHWNAATVHASSGTHRQFDNPLRVGDRLPTWCAIEYAAQAMAVHGALTGAVSARTRSGYLVSVRNVSCATDRIDDTPEDLYVEATQLMGDAERVTYAFTVRLGEREVVHGTATVILDAALAS